MCGHFVGLKFTPRCRSRPPSGPNTRVAARHPCHNAYVRVYCLLRGAKKISRQTECERFLSLKPLAPPRTPSLPLPRTRSAAHCVACRLSRQLWILMWWCECVHARGCTFNCCVYDKYLFVCAGVFLLLSLLSPPISLPLLSSLHCSRSSTCACTRCRVSRAVV